MLGLIFSIKRFPLGPEIGQIMLEELYKLLAS